ncbi:MAG TPA: hypothetical protein DCW29_03990 [Janthinobacterium sp.]|nr:hypothetical protein [Janthinobacterium sp.]
MAHAIPVLPAPAGGSENPHVDGGNIVAPFGRPAPGGIDPVQLAFGAQWRGAGRCGDDMSS